MIDRRTLIAGASATAALAVSPMARAAGPRRFPTGFLWGAATAGHQVEGNDTASDTWFLANIKPTVFAEPAGDAANSFVRWADDLDLCRAMGLNAYRFSVEWSRIEPEKGMVSPAMLDLYRRMIEGCHARGLAPVVTLNHFTSPRWFAADGGWLNPDAPERFAAQCDRVMRAMGDGISHAITFNEPNIFRLLDGLLPQPVRDLERATLERAGQLTGSSHFVASNVVRPEDCDAMEAGLLRGHALARQAIKAVRGDVPVGCSLAVIDEQAVRGGEAMRDATRQRLYGAWIESARKDDFVGVQNYERRLWGPEGRRPAPAGAQRSQTGQEIDPASLAGAVRYIHQATKVPIFVTEHGLSSTDDAARARIIPEALVHLHTAIADGVPVIGYCHWSLIDNFEWIFGYGPKYGLHSFDRQTFVRTAKPSAAVYGAIAKTNAL